MRVYAAAAVMVCVITSGCSSNGPSQPILKATPTVKSQKYDEALGWMVSIESSGDITETMPIAQKFCANKGKIPTLYQSSGSTEVWVCQTPPALNDTDLMRGVYCHFISYAPRYTVDITDDEKKKAESHFINTLVKKGVEFPVGGVYEKYQQSFAVWAMAKSQQKGNTDAVLEWFKYNCT